MKRLPVLSRAGLQRLLERRSLREVTVVPPASAGFIPFARVAHAKYMVVDGQHSWIGTSNWEKDYFERSRNVGLLIDGQRIGAQLDSFFVSNWDSPYAQLVDPTKSYAEPRIGD